MRQLTTPRQPSWQDTAVETTELVKKGREDFRPRGHFCPLSMFNGSFEDDVENYNECATADLTITGEKIRKTNNVRTVFNCERNYEKPSVI